MIVYLCPGTPDTLSGGTRKLYDHVAILQDHGFAAELIYTDDVDGYSFTEHDLVVVPEVYGDKLRTLLPPGIPRAVFVQNSYLTDVVDGVVVVKNGREHPYLRTPELVAVLCESLHSEQRLHMLFPELPVPIIRTHSSGNGRRGKDAGFSYGEWPRRREVVYFGYKHESDNARVLDGLDLPDGWETLTMTGMTDAQIAETLRTAAIFLATNREEGMCAPTSEAMIAGTVECVWTGGGPDEYLLGRSVVARQDDPDALRRAVEWTARSIDEHPDVWAALTRRWSDWFRATYSREREVDEICAIMRDLHG